MVQRRAGRDGTALFAPVGLGGVGYSRAEQSRVEQRGESIIDVYIVAL